MTDLKPIWCGFFPFIKKWHSQVHDMDPLFSRVHKHSQKTSAIITY
jgi:hypothetical protein